MALIQCPKCGQQISEHARKCPKCGADFTKNQDSVNNDVLLESNPKDTPSKKEHSHKLWIWLVAVFAIIVVLLSTVYLYHKNEEPKQNAELSQLHQLDSIAAAKEPVANSALRQDSIERADFVKGLVDINIFIERKPMEWGDGSYEVPYFKDHITKSLEELGYQKTDTKRGTREGEGGDYDNYAIQTYEKRFHNLDDTDLWSKIVFNDGECGGYTIYFCNKEQMNKFLESCKRLGYTQNYTEGDTKYLRIPLENADSFDYYHKNYNCIIELKDNSVTICFGCI